MTEQTKILFLGTSAANFSPKLKNECKHRFDPDARRASCLLIDETILLDCGMYCMESLAIAKCDLSKITDVFVTHFHADHFTPEHAAKLAEGKKEPLRIWCRRDAQVPQIPNTEIIRMQTGTVYELEDTKVFAVDANHDPASFPQHYIFERNGKKLMYALDGAWFLTASYNRLKNEKLDVLIIDATVGDKIGDYRAAEHNSIPMLRLLLPSLKTNGTITDQTAVYLSHIAPSLHATHAETVKLVEKDGMKVAYDGLSIEF